jgi:hypothetical protein
MAEDWLFNAAHVKLAGWMASLSDMFTAALMQRGNEVSWRVLSDFAPVRIFVLKVVCTAHAACITLSAMRALWRKWLKRREAETY